MSHKHGADLGGIRTVEDLRLRSRIDDETGCWLWGLSTCRGHPRVWLVLPNGGRFKSTGAMAAYYLDHGKKPRKGSIAYRTCCVNLCVNPDHVKAGTRSDHGAFIRSIEVWKNNPKRTSANHKTMLTRKNTKLNAEIAREIRLSDLSDGELALKHNIAKSQINAIRHGRSWREGLRNNSVFNLA